MSFKLDKIQKTSTKKSNFSIEDLLKKEISFGSNPFTDKYKEGFYTELSVLLSAGISLKDSLVLIIDSFKKEQLKVKIQQVLDSIILGKSFSEAIKKTGNFSNYEYYSLKIGEETGDLAFVTKELNTFYKAKNQQRRTIMNAMSYPIIVMLTALMAIVFMLQFVVPMFVDIFKQNKVDLPAITKFIVATSEGMQDHYIAILLVIISLFITNKLLKSKDTYLRIKSNIYLRIPYVGELIRKVQMQQFTQATSLLISAKLPLLQSIELTKKMIVFHPLRSALISIEKELIQGVELSTAMSKHKIFDKKMIALIKVAEQTNSNDYIFAQLTTQYREDIEQQSKLLNTVLEPFIILFLGGLVGTVLVAMYLPMFKLSTAITS